MSIPPDELDAMAKACLRVHAAIHQARLSLKRGDKQSADALLDAAQESNWTTKRALQRHGAEEPLPDHWKEEDKAKVKASREVPLELLSSPANRRYAQRLREAYEALIEVEKERGIFGNGASEGMAETLAAVELEVYGPKGLRGLE